jgi:hypothetical protein
VTALLIAYAAGGLTVVAWSASTVLLLLAFHEAVDPPYPDPPQHPHHESEAVS